MKSLEANYIGLDRVQIRQLLDSIEDGYRKLLREAMEDGEGVTVYSGRHTGSGYVTEATPEYYVLDGGCRQTYDMISGILKRKGGRGCMW
jgi:hypothetical protein